MVPVTALFWKSLRVPRSVKRARRGGGRRARGVPADAQESQHRAVAELGRDGARIREAPHEHRHARAHRRAVPAGRRAAGAVVRREGRRERVVREAALGPMRLGRRVRGGGGSRRGSRRRGSRRRSRRGARRRMPPQRHAQRGDAREKRDGAHTDGESGSDNVPATTPTFLPDSGLKIWPWRSFGSPYLKLPQPKVGLSRLRCQCPPHEPRALPVAGS